MASHRAKPSKDDSASEREPSYDIQTRYLAEIGRYELLTAEDEVELGRRMAEGDEEARRRMIICNLRLVRTDGHPLQFSEALVRGLTGIFSLAVAGIGFLWILRDPERQAWHDRVAGTYVVKVPRSYPI